MSNTKNTDSTKNAIRSFFTNDLHNFPDTDQAVWVKFASNTSLLIENILHTVKTDISLIELLQILAQERAKFAQQQPGIAEDKVSKFGQWRDGVYSLNSEQASLAMDRRIALNQALKKAGHTPLGYEVDASICHSFYSKEKPLFTSVIQNLELCEQKDSAHLLISPEVDKTTLKAINEIIKGKVNISPPSFFDINMYKKYTLIDKEGISAPLTSFFVLSKPGPTFFVLLEHPPANIVCSLLANNINQLFLALLETKKDTSLFIKKLSEFLWYCHQLMPFERGSASIFLILTSALLQYAEIPLKRYPENRLDIDAISLSKTLFSQKFIATYSK